MKRISFFLFTLLIPVLLIAQNTQDSPVLCGNSLVHSPQMQQRMAYIDSIWAIDAPDFPPPSTQSLYTLPVVVHIVHYAGTPLGTNENISNAVAQDAITWLNEAYANIGYYDPATGVNTDIQFCLAQRDANGAATTGIEHVASPLSYMVMETQDTLLKDVSRWNPNCFINIWVVDEICSNAMGCGVAGYAYFPAAHGTVIDGIVIEHGYFGSSQANNTVLVHEMGHYLGLYHTFEGGCTNNNCLLDGDKVCDTPPDQSTTWLACGNTANTCSTDALSGFASDVNDMVENYMDYNSPSCYSIFTANQSTRMQWSIANERNSLLSCQSCVTPCLNPFVASFTAPNTTIGVGTNLAFTNTSTGGTAYVWQVNGTNFAATTNANYTFNTIGTYTVTLIATDGLTCSYTYEMEITVISPVVASFTTSSLNISPGGSVTFTNTSTGATAYQWFVSFVNVGNTTNLTQVFPNVGQYQVYLVADNSGLCANSSQIVTVNVGNDCSQISAGIDVSICADDTALLQGNFSTPIPGATIQWTGGGGTFLPNANVLTPQYIPTPAEIAAGVANLQMQVDFIAPGSSITPRLLGYGHNGQDDIYYIDPIPAGAVSILTSNFGDDWLAMGLDIAANVVYGVRYGSGNNILSKWDLTTLTHTQITIGPYPENMTGGDYDNTNSIFYTVGAQWGTNMPQKLFNINTTTGVATLIGNLGITATFPGYVPQGEGLGGIAYDPLLNVLYGVSATTDNLYTINVTTGAATLVAPLSQTGLTTRGLAYDFHLGKLWAQDGAGVLYEIDKNTGVILSTINNAAPMPGAGLTYAPLIVGSTQPITCFDSMKITIHPLPSVALGNDTSFCGVNGVAISLVVSAGSVWQWENGSMTSPRTISTTGIYWVEATDAFGCQNSDTIDINVIQQPNLTLNLGTDITTCQAEVIVLDAGTGFASYLWYNLSPNQTNTVFGSGTYYVKCTDLCGNVYKDTININISLIPVDTFAAIICNGDTCTLPNGTIVSNVGNYTNTILSAQGCDSTIVVELSFYPNIAATDIYPTICVGENYLLPNGTNTNTIGIYPIMLASSTGCDSLVNVHLDVLPTFLQDIYATICKGKSYILPNGIAKTVTGTYPVILTATNGCDSTIITHLTVNPAPISHIYFTVCKNDSVLLPNGTNTLAEGTIKTTISTPQGCDSIVYTHIKRKDIVWKEVPTEYELCREQSAVRINVMQPFETSYLWNNGSNYYEFIAENEGIFWVQMMACGEQKIDTFHVTHCPELFVPSVFTPNRDGINDEWGAVGLGITSFELILFDRWGKEVLRFASINDTWNGKVKGQDAPEGVYTYKIKATTYNEKPLSQHGTVTLIR